MKGTTLHLYIDSNLGDEGKGETLASAVANLGFNRIHIATGYEVNTVAAPACVMSVVGKDPAF